MCTIRKLVLSLFVASILSGCAARRYQPVPIVSTQTASMLETRSFGDSGLPKSRHLARLSQLRALFGFFVMIFVFKPCVFIMGI